MPDLPVTGRGKADPAQIRLRRAGDADSNGWQMGPAGQRLREAESVRAVPGRPIKLRSTGSARRLRDRRRGHQRGLGFGWGSLELT
jgi:hypothetical protein